MALISKPLLLLLLLLASSSSSFISCSNSEANLHSYTSPQAANGLSWDFYRDSCPQVELVIRRQLRAAFSADIGLAAGILRIFFHDCFVQGCDGSVLLVGEGGEQSAIQNWSLRPTALQAINHLRDAVEAACGLVVSCADITAIAARESVFLAGGPYFVLPLGRRDSLTSASAVTATINLPNTTDSISALLALFSSKSLDVEDLVALSGAHTIGVGHCPAFSNRLYPTQDPTLNPPFAKQLYVTCPNDQSLNFTVNDVLTPYTFDNAYFVDLVNGEGLFSSDQWLLSDARTLPAVEKFAKDKVAFFEEFVEAMVKMSQLNVITGTKGEIRRKCFVPNAAWSASPATLTAEG